MKKTELFRKVLSLLLVVTMLAGFALPADAVNAERELRFDLEQIDNSAVTAEPLNHMGSLSDLTASAQKNPDEIVRATIHLEKAAAIGAGFELKTIGSDVSAMSYRQELHREQLQLQQTIERKVLKGRELDVVWNLTLAANLISVNVPRWAMAEIARLDGVRSVVEENCYAPDVVSIGGEYTTDMAISGQMTGADAAWLEGYTGAGSRVAIIDTGLDTDHQSFDALALINALKQTGKPYSLMDSTDIAPVLTELNAYKTMVAQGKTLSAHDLYVSAKVPYGFNYVDADLDITHDNDDQGEHGSHVAGIAAANRLIGKNGLFVDALEEVHVAGTAPDAQILVMKVFGKNGGAFDSDILASIEDAMVLGADSVNLSLGSTNAGPSYDNGYTDIMERVKRSGMTVIASAGNDGPWSAYTTNGYLYSEDVNLDTVGSPGSYPGFMAVASVDNDGTIGSSIVVSGNAYGYAETLADPETGAAYGNNPLSYLDGSANGTGTEYEFVHISGLGKTADYAGIDLTGKIAVCSRGELYYSEKADNAAALGAAALLIYNNEPGVVHADLTGISYTMPVVTITQEAGAAIAAAGTEFTSKSGVVYRTGKLSIRAAQSGNYFDSAYKTMSSFSSFGVPGDLSLKPDITAPGGNIYSVNGLVPETDQYEIMSGTSMAAPQVAGLSAVVSQYLRENELAFGDMSQRALINALLMSTSEPLFSSEGIYYPVIQQGSGLANVSAAVRTPAFLTVDGMDDGMVKAQLGDDADRTGVYTFSFKLNNLTGEAVSYRLSADAFTQDIFQDEAGFSYMDLLTRNLDADALFLVNGKALNAVSDANACLDFNGDSRVTRADGQALLDHAVLGTALAANADAADLNGDGTVNTYDVHLFLKQYQSAVEVPANSSVTVEVTLTLSDAEKALLNEENPNGAYIQAFIKAVPLATDEGELLPTLSLPMLAFYGDWSDPSMYEVGDQITFATGEERRSPYMGSIYSNAVGIIYGDKPYEVWYYGGNPIVPDAAYIPERNAINTERGDYFYQWSYAPIRNAEATRFQAINTTTGEVWMDQVGGPVSAGFFYYAYQSWMDTPQYLEIGLTPELNPGEYGLLKLSLATEYHVKDGQVDWDSLGKGATMELPFTVDNEAPEILDVTVDTERNVMRVTASDDQYVAGVVLYDVTGNRRLAYAGTTAEAQPGDTITFELSLENVDGYKFIVQTSDYASNIVTYEIRQTIGEPAPLPTRLAFDENFGDWATFAKEGYYWNTAEWFNSNITPVAGTAIGEYAMVVDASNKLYVIPVEDMLDEIFVRKLPVALTDMAYDASTATAYGITAEGELYAIDKYTGELTGLGNVGLNTTTLANDGNGTFYCVSVFVEGDGGYYATYRYDLYSFTLNADGTIGEPVLIGSPYSGSANPAAYSTLEYDPANSIVCMLARVPGYSYDYSYYFEFDPTTGASLITDYYPPMPFTKAAAALIFPQWGEEHGAWAAPTDVPASVTFAKEEAEVLMGLTTQLSAAILPWNLSNKYLVWSSADESIATVDASGLVTGTGLGTTTIRAASRLDETVYGECTVTVKELEVTVNGLLMDELGTTRFYSWDMSEDLGAVYGDVLDHVPMSVTRVNGTDTFYLLDNNTGTMHLLDSNGSELADPYDVYYQQNFWIWDLAYSQYFSTEEAPAAFGIRENAVIAPFSVMDPSFVNFDMGRYGVSFLTGVASAGHEKITYKDWYGYDAEADSELIYMIDDGGYVWRCNMFQDYGSWDMVMESFPSDLDLRYPVDFSGHSSLVVGEDNALYYSAWTGKTNEVYRLVYDDLSESYLSTFLGSFGTDVWPALILDVTANAPAAPMAPQGTQRYNTVPTGSLNAVTAGQAENTADNGLITVPVTAISSTNGLFELTYDTALLELVEASAGAVMNAIDTTAAGTVRMGYADADALNAVVATVSFRAAEGVSEATLTLTTHEDGETTPAATQELTVKVEQEAATENPFTDVPNDSFCIDAVLWAVEEGITEGTSDTTFNPGGACQRAVVVTFLWRAAGSPEPTTTENPFTDVKENAFYYKAVLWAVEKGITTGTSETTFDPGALCNRATVVTFLYRALGEPEVTTTENPFTDVKADSWYGPAVLWAVENDVTTGVGNGLFAPGTNCNRAQVVTFLHRAMA